MDNKHDILTLLRDVADGAISPEDALLQFKEAPFEDLDYAKIDYHRSVRQGAAEVIYGAGKTPEQIVGIVTAMGNRGVKNILVTRISEEAAKLLEKTVPVNYHPLPGIAVAFPEEREKRGNIVVATGGTSDIPVAEEAALTAETMGNHVTRLYDVGVAGLHRLLSNMDVLMSARCVVAVAGMEGALASVIGGLSALLSMLNSCASGCSVVNIDNGFGAGYLASMINQMEGIEPPQGTADHKGGETV